MVAIYVRQQLIEPILSFSECGKVSYHAQSTQVSSGVGTYTGEIVRVGREVPSSLHRSQTKRLTRGFKGQAVINNLPIWKAGKWCVLVPLGHEVTMDFIREHDHSMFQADFPHPCQVLWRPTVTGWILRITEDEDIGCPGSPLKIFEIN